MQLLSEHVTTRQVNIMQEQQPSARLIFMYKKLQFTNNIILMISHQLFHG